MNILIYTPQLPPQIGGVGVTVKRIISKLSQNAFIHVLMPSPSEDMRNKIINNFNLHSNNVKVYFLPSRKPSLIFRLILGRMLLDVAYFFKNYRHYDHYNLVSTINPDSIIIVDPIGLAGFPIFFGYGKPVACNTSHYKNDNLVVYYHTHYLGGIKYYGCITKLLFNKLSRDITKNILSFYDEVVVFSPYIQQQLCDLGIINTKVMSIEGLEINRMNKFLNGIEKRENRKLTLIFFGRLMKEKNIKMIVEIINMLSIKNIEDIKVKIIGSGPEVDQFSNLCDDIDIEIINWIENEELFFHVAKADIFINCSDFETLGLSMAESMYLQCIPLAYFKGGHTKLINHGENGFLCKNVSDYVDYILLIKNDSELQKKLSKAAQRTIIDEFSLDRNLNNLFALLNIK
jgi:glycosyltransferase involved in cell wall biosynthesis